MSVAATSAKAAAQPDPNTMFLPSDSPPLEGESPAAVPGVVVEVQVDRKEPEQSPEQIRLAVLAKTYHSLTRSLPPLGIPLEVTHKKDKETPCPLEKARTALSKSEFYPLLCYTRESATIPCMPVATTKPAIVENAFNELRTSIVDHKRTITECEETIIQPSCVSPKMHFYGTLTSTIVFGAATAVTVLVPPETLGINTQDRDAVIGLIVARIVSVVGTTVGPILEARENLKASDAAILQNKTTEQLTQTISIRRTHIERQVHEYTLFWKKVVLEWVENTPCWGKPVLRRKAETLCIFGKDKSASDAALIEKEAAKIALLEAINNVWRKSLPELHDYWTALLSEDPAARDGEEDAIKIMRPADQAICVIQFDAAVNVGGLKSLRDDHAIIADNPMFSHLRNLRGLQEGQIRELIDGVVATRGGKAPVESMFHYAAEPPAAPADSLKQRRGTKAGLPAATAASGASLSTVVSPIASLSPRPAAAGPAPQSVGTKRKGSRAGVHHAHSSSISQTQTATFTGTAGSMGARTTKRANSSDGSQHSGGSASTAPAKKQPSPPLSNVAEAPDESSPTAAAASAKATAKAAAPSKHAQVAVVVQKV